MPAQQSPPSSSCPAVELSSNHCAPASWSACPPPHPVVCLRSNSTSLYRAVESLADYWHSFALFPPIYLALILIRQARAPSICSFVAALLFGRVLPFNRRRNAGMHMCSGDTCCATLAARPGWDPTCPCLRRCVFQSHSLVLMPPSFAGALVSAYSTRSSPCWASRRCPHGQ